MGGQPVETEVKIRVADCDSARALLEAHGFQVSAPRVFEANNVYDLPGGDLRARGCLLRLRQAGSRSVLTFKGVTVPGVHKSRPETEVEVSDFESCDSILRQLGYSLGFRYEKYRTEYTRPDEVGTATVDETPIGCYVELEGSADWIDTIAATLGFSPQSYITLSYGSLYLEHCCRIGVQPQHMIFS